MSLFTTIWRRLHSLGQGRVMKQEIDEELRFHIEQRTSENIAAGIPPEEAAREAGKRFGNWQSIREQCRERRGVSFVEETWQDIRFGARQLRKSPGFTAVAVLTLALGIGANTAIFSMVNALLFRPLPFRDPQRLVWIANQFPGGAGLSGETTRVANFSDWRQQNQSFESLAAYFAFFDFNNYTLTSDGEPVRLQGAGVSQNFLDTLGVRPRIGRGFADEECRWNGKKAILLTDAFWKRQFQSRPDIVGRTVTLNNAATEVVGILPPSFDFSSIFAPGSSVDIVEPFPISDETDQWGNTLSVVGRLKPGVTVATAQAEFDVMNQRLEHDHPERGTVFGARMTPLPQKINGQFRRAFLVLFGAVGCVLLIACANVSNLLLARAVARRKELAVRIALGASRLRLIRQMLTESLMLACCGAALGLPIAFASAAALAQSHAFNIALLQTVGIDQTALGFTLLIAFSSALLFGTIPALNLSGGSVHDSMKESSRGSSHGRSHTWIRETLVAVEVALACVLMVGAGLLLRSFVRLIEVNPGFRPEQVVAWSIQPSRSFANNDAQAVYYHELVRSVQALPGVDSAGMSDALPLGRNRSWSTIAKGEKYRPGEDAFPRIVDEGYIRTMQIPLHSGREFDVHDTMDGAGKVAIINETMARRFWSGTDAVGRIIVTSGMDFQVVGVVGDVRHAALEEKSGAEMYLLGAQLGWGSEELVVRTKGSLESVVPSVRAALRQMDPGMPVEGFRSLGEIVDQAVSPRRLIVLLLGFFSLLALILASVGIYGVISYAVSQRTPELGIRLALGATPRGILWLVIREGMKPVAIGLLGGLAAAAALTRVAQSLLFGISATDPLTFFCNALLFLCVGLLACWLPARHAAKVDPMVALRHE
jgi:putative ABC transport system permease protein